MQPNVEDRYHEALADMGDGKRWYQTGSDLLWAAVVAAVDKVSAAEIQAAYEPLRAALPMNHEFTLISHSVAAVCAARRIEPESLAANTDVFAEELREVTRSRRARRMAGAVIAAGGANDTAAENVGRLHEDWNRRHRILTTALDVVLAAVTEVAEVDRYSAVNRAQTALGQLAGGGYRGEWEPARILALDATISTVPRFLRLAGELRGRRRKPLTDRRHLIAIAALADHTPEELAAVVADRTEALQVGRFRPDRSTAIALAALMALGASVPADHRLRTAFHGFLLREHYVTAYREATAG